MPESNPALSFSETQEIDMVHARRALTRCLSTARVTIAWPLALAAGAWLGGSAQAQLTAFQATINQAQEVPPTGSAQTGFGFFTFNAATNALAYNINFSPLPTGEIAAHLHQGAVGVSGNVIVPLPLGTSINGTLSIPAAQVANVLAGNTYVNFHSNAFPNGEIRGQVIHPPTLGTSSCDANSATPCPCGNPPSGPGRGCDNSSATGGAVLSAGGNASLASDTVVFTTTAEKPTATSIVLQGQVLIGPITFGQGLRCVNGNLKRLYTKTASSGSIAAPSPTDVRVSARSAALGDVISAGTSRSYMVYYRDPTVLGGCPTASTFNGTQAVTFTWNP
jgi:hypothetical protein